MYEIKQNIILNNEAKGIFLELVQNDGNNKNFKMLPELVPSRCTPMPWGFFQMMTLCWPWPFLWQGKICFLMLLYGWQIIQHWVPMYSKFVLIQRIFSTQGSDTGPMVLWWLTTWKRTAFCLENYGSFKGSSTCCVRYVPSDLKRTETYGSLSGT